MVTTDSIKSKIQNLISKANETTGNTDSDLTSSVESLIEGYGHGEESGGITPYVNDLAELIGGDA